MQPKWYCDIDVKTAPLPRPTAASAIVRVMHGAFRQAPGQYALAMPNHQRLPHSVLRVFASTRDELDALIENIREAKPLIEQGLIQYPRSVPDHYAGTWHVYERFRIPARRAERIPDRSVRLKRMQQAEALPFFQLKSESNGGRFRLYWSARPYQHESPQQQESHPDSWGLSTATNPVPVPDLD